jgi:NAD(P)-dependent dehydrogenase (short-subunit alcohol dehydrogenase family)
VEDYTVGMRDINGKVVLITGGGRGIGRETALLFVQEGAKVVISDIDTESLASTEQKLLRHSSDVLAVQGDVSSRDDAERLLREIHERFGRLDVLINNAGITSRAVFEDTSLEVFEAIVRINFLGPVIMTKTVLPLIRASRGSIIFISSIAGLRGLPGAAPYCASKMVLKSFSESLRSELMDNGVHVGLIYLGFTQNDPEKTFYTGDGKLTILRQHKFSLTQVQVARGILKMIVKRRSVKVLSAIGKLIRLAYALLPRISELALAKRALKTDLYKTE